MESKKKILITGSNGLLGQKLVYNLLKRNDVEVMATSKGENRLLSKAGYHYLTLDITNEKQVVSAIKNFHPDTVINSAAMTNVDACEKDKALCKKINVDGVKYLINACEEVNAHLIHLSTDFIFDGENGCYKEDDAPNPLSYYGWSKCEAEHLVQESSLQWAIMRTILVYGITDNLSRSNIILWAKGALEKKQHINVVNDQFRMPTLAEDLAEGCILAAMKQATGIYHISGKDYMSIIELVKKVADFYKLDKSLIHPVSSKTLNQPAKRPPKTGFVLKKAMHNLDYHPHSFEEGLRILTSQLGAG